MYTDEDNNSNLMEHFVNSYSHGKDGIIVDDYGNEWLVQLTNGKEVPVYKDEVFIV